MMEEDIAGLLEKYDVPNPRYTSYPTVPYWEKESISAESWLESVIRTFESENGNVSLYIHLPFCESLCTFCACNKRITKNHAVEDGYIQAVLKEWKMYLNELPFPPVIKEIHLGGGTPTFFSPENLKLLIEGISSNCEIAEDAEFSVEIHPNNTTFEHLKLLKSVGFDRISLGVQDFDAKVQFIINRNQTYEKTVEVVEWARSLGYSSLNIDLVYGLPRQTVKSIIYTVEKIKSLKPDRIAYYSYAHVPWKSKGQRRYTEADLPAAAEKWEMYQAGRSELFELGYEAIGMDHFALAEDSLSKSFKEGSMHRNFMGYTTRNNKLLIGLGVSSIGDSWGAFMQNEKVVETYQSTVEAGNWPFLTGHLLNEEDLVIRKHLLDLICRGNTDFTDAFLDLNFLESVFQKLEKYKGDNLVHLEGDRLEVTPLGQLFIRNICSALDAKMWRKKSNEKVFSKSI